MYELRRRRPKPTHLSTQRILIPPSHQTGSHYLCMNALKLCANFLNVVQTSWTGYKLSECARMSRTLNLLKVFWQSSHSEPILKNEARTSLV